MLDAAPAPMSKSRSMRSAEECSACGVQLPPRTSAVSDGVPPLRTAYGRTVMVRVGGIGAPVLCMHTGSGSKVGRMSSFLKGGRRGAKGAVSRPLHREMSWMLKPVRRGVSGSTTRHRVAAGPVACGHNGYEASACALLMQEARFGLARGKVVGRQFSRRGQGGDFAADGLRDRRRSRLGLHQDSGRMV